MPSPPTTVFTALILTVATAQHALAQGNGSNHSQNIQTNNGVSIQLNIQQNLQKAATRSQLNEHGWMRLLTPAHDKTPANNCGKLEKLPQFGPNTLKVFYGTNVDFCIRDNCDIVAGIRGEKKMPPVTVHKVRGALCSMHGCLIKMEI